MLLVWCDTPFGAADAGPGNNVYFGTFRSDSAISFSDIGWVVPADGATVNLNYLTSSFGGDTPESAGRAQFKTVPSVTTAIPSPSAAALGLAGFALIALKQRRHSN